MLHASRIRKPRIVIQGANDPRVIEPESDDVEAAVRKNGGSVEDVVFDDEGHGFRKRKNDIAAWGAILKFLDANLELASPAAK